MIAGSKAHADAAHLLFDSGADKNLADQDLRQGCMITANAGRVDLVCACSWQSEGPV